MSLLDSSDLPPNARIDAVTFDADGKSMRVKLRGADEDRAVAAEAIAGLFGGRIRHDTVTTTAGSGGISFGKVAMTMATGIPVGITKGGPKEKSVVGQELHHAVALRVTGVPEVWYLLAASFNFRKALGAEATYSSETNLRLFVKRLAAFAPQAPRNDYVTAMATNAPLPDPLASLLEFLRSTASI